MAINEIVFTVTIIFQILSSNIVGSATGFFYVDDNKLYLVTNKHVFEGDSLIGTPESIKLILHKNPNDLTQNDEYEIILYENNNSLWLTHPHNPNADIALIEINKHKIENDFYIKAWSKNSYLPENYRLDPGEDVFIMGYPKAFRDIQNNLPIFRNAMVASTYGVDFRNIPLFLTDANLHPGTSGSPVITKPKNTWVDNNGNTNLMTGTIYYLLGIHTGTVDPVFTGGVEIGLGAAWYIKLVDEIINRN